MHLKSARKKEIFLTIINNLLLQLVTAITGFILPPLIIETYGSSINGMVSSISQFISYLSIVEAGVGGASIVALYKPLGVNDTFKRNAILSATTKFYNHSGFLFIGLVLALSIVYPLIIRNEVDRSLAACMVLVLGISGTADFFFIGKYRVLLTADKKVYIISLVQMCALIISTVFAIIFIKMGFSILFIKFFSAVVYLGRYILLSIYVHSHYKDLSFKMIPDTKAISQSKNVIIHQIGGLVVFNSPFVIITLFCSLKDVSVYTVYALVFNAINQLLGAFYNGFQAFLGESLVKDSIKKTQMIFDSYETLFYIISCWFYSCAFVLVLPFMAVYTSKMTDAEYIQPLLAMFFCLVGFANNLRRPCDLLIMAAGHYRQTQWRSILESVINIVASVLFTLKFGFIGVLLGGLTSYSYRTFDIIIYSNLHILKRNIVHSVIKIILLIGLYFPLIYFVSKLTFKIYDYISWFEYAILCSVILGIPFCVFFLARKVGNNV